MRLCIDLCSGLGGFSQAFRNDSNWEVVRIDIERRFKPTIQADVRFLPLRDEMHCDVVLASPPCERFSYAPHNWPMKGIKLAMEIAGSIFEWIAKVKPDYWMVENPKGYLVSLMSIKPKMVIKQSHYGSPFLKPTALFGNVELGLVDSMKQHTFYVSEPYHDERAPKKPLPLLTRNSSVRAMLPLGLSVAIKEAIES